MGQCILLQDDKLPCASLSWKCRSLRVNSVTRSVRAQEILHACMPNLVSLPATHHSCVGIRCDICKKNRSEPCPCIPIIEVACPLLLAPSHAKLATAKLAGRSRRARPGQGRRHGTRQNEETLPCACLHALHEQWSRLVCSVLVNSNSLTANYGAKQNQFTKLTSEPPH